MATEVQSMPKQAGPPKRRLRNYLLDPRFQLKYTAMVVVVTVLVTSLVGGWLGTEAYNYSTGMTEMLAIDRLMDDPGAQETIEREARAEDINVRNRIVIGVVALVVIVSVALGLTGIVVTHRVVGPAYKLRLMLGDIERGSLALRGGFRKGDELQELGEAFKRMVVSLRTRREGEVAQLDALIEKARESGVDKAVLEEMTALREKMHEPIA